MQPEVQKSRQNVFRMVTWAGTLLSVECTKEVLCEQSCKDRSTSSFERSDYPVIMENDTDLNKEYVLAYNSGEQMAICEPIKSLNDQDKTEFCNKKCQTLYGQGCKVDEENSTTVKLYHQFARVFHKSGMFTFGAMWYARGIIDNTIGKVKGIGQVVKNSAKAINNKLTDILHGFTSLFASNKSSGNTNSSAGVRNEKWFSFLKSKNSTDPDLYTWLSAYDFNQFKTEVEKFNSTMHNFHFEKNYS